MLFLNNKKKKKRYEVIYFISYWLCKQNVSWLVTCFFLSCIYCCFPSLLYFSVFIIKDCCMSAKCTLKALLCSTVRPDRTLSCELSSLISGMKHFLLWFSGNICENVLKSCFFYLKMSKHQKNCNKLLSLWLKLSSDERWEQYFRETTPL